MRQTAFIAFLLALVLMAASLLIPKTAHREEQLQESHLGLPFAFIWQDLTSYDHPLPHRYRLSSPWENPTHILWPELVASLVVLWLAALTLLNLLSRSGSDPQ